MVSSVRSQERVGASNLENLSIAAPRVPSFQQSGRHGLADLREGEPMGHQMADTGRARPMTLTMKRV